MFTLLLLLGGAVVGCLLSFFSVDFVFGAVIIGADDVDDAAMKASFTPAEKLWPLLFPDCAFTDVDDVGGNGGVREIPNTSGEFERSTPYGIMNTLFIASDTVF